MEYMAGMSDWLRLIFMEKYFTQGCNQVLEETPQSQLIEISYDDLTYCTPHRPSMAEKTLLVKISW
jgi:hypothetical protein